ncbi:MAG TPA: DUF2059 domain-containing protein [Terriglobales bacterium]
MRIAAMALLLCLGMTGLSAAQAAPAARSRAATTPAAKHQDTERLMELVGTRQILRDIFDQDIDAQIAAMRHARPDVPEQFWQDFAVEFKRQASPDELMKAILPIYDKHFTHQEIRQLIAFYQSPLGRKISTTLPEIQRESIEAGRNWGEQLGDRMHAELKQRLTEKGYSSPQ